MATTRAVEPAVIVLNNIDEENGKPRLEVQLMPCKIEYTGSANVSTYMLREQHRGGHEKSTFRGRFLDGLKTDVPPNYKLYTLKERRKNGNIGIYDVEQASDDFMVWEYDKVPSESDPIRRAVKFLEIAEDLAAD